MKSLLLLPVLLFALLFITSRSLMAKADLPIEIFVMSKCPDAIYTESTFASILPVAGASVTLQFIADPKTLACKHGESECRGNQLELSIQSAVPSKLFDFLAIYNRKMDEIGHESDDRLMALLHDAGLLDGEAGSVIAAYQDELDSGTLLRASAEHASSLGVKYSATIRIDDEIVGIRDGGRWKEMRHGIDGSAESWKSYIASKLHDRRSSF